MKTLPIAFALIVMAGTTVIAWYRATTAMLYNDGHECINWNVQGEGWYEVAILTAALALTPAVYIWIRNVIIKGE